MPLPEVLVEVATNLRTTNAVLQLLDTNSVEAGAQPTVEAVKQKSTEVVEQLRTLDDHAEVGAVPPPLQGAVFPTPGVMLGTSASLDADIKRMDEVTKSELGDVKFEKFEELRTRVFALKSSVATATVRKK